MMSESDLKGELTDLEIEELATLKNELRELEKVTDEL